MGVIASDPVALRSRLLEFALLEDFAFGERATAPGVTGLGRDFLDRLDAEGGRERAARWYRSFRRTLNELEMLRKALDEDPRSVGDEDLEEGEKAADLALRALQLWLGS